MDRQRRSDNGPYRMRNKSLQQIMTGRFFGKIGRAAALYIVFLIFGLIAGALILGSKTWYGTELLYPLLRWISDNRILTIILAFMIGFIFIFAYYWREMISYFGDLLTGMEHLYNNVDAPIQLKSDLIEVESQMNEIRTNIIRDRWAAKEAEQRKNDLVVYLAHDLKTPLTSIIGYLSLLDEEPEMKEVSRRKYINVALQKSGRLEELINEFFEITRFNLTHIELEMSTINLTRLLEQIAFEFQPLCREKNIDCTLNVQPDIMYTCDPNKLQRVFDNLLKNGVNYGYRDSEMEVGLSKKDGEITILIKNHGPTIPAEKQKRIFEQFYRLDQARGTQSGGSGLGLAIAKEIVEQHGGALQVESKDEVTIFYVHLRNVRS